MSTSADDQTKAIEATRLKDEGNAAVKAKDYDTAIEAYTKAIALAPDNEVLYSNRSACYLAKGEKEKALNDSMETVRLRTEWFKGYARQGEAYLSMGKYAEACSAYQTAIEKQQGIASETLTENLQSARDRLRNQWRQHPNYRGPAGHLIYFHDSYRRAVQEIEAMAGTIPAASDEQTKLAAVNSISNAMVSLHNTLSHHHSIEESYMFPALENKYGINTSSLERDHRAMNVCSSTMRQSEASYRTTKEKKFLDHYHQSTVRFCDILKKHLLAEEDICCPHLLKSTDFSQLM
eukprot:GFYU01021208.1.p1 GENE.GFYU01021208.1~~GFYU01021208.1.p1  ORF type:complete len:300 (-),score=41.06 GFYU01021208.1:119-994(-)